MPCVLVVMVTWLAPLTVAALAVRPPLKVNWLPSATRVLPSIARLKVTTTLSAAVDSAVVTLGAGQLVIIRSEATQAEGSALAAKRHSGVGPTVTTQPVERSYWSRSGVGRRSLKVLTAVGMPVLVICAAT